MSDFLLTLIINYGAPIFALLLLLGALGVPIGASVLVIAAGAFSQQGILNWYSTATLGLIGVVIGDAVSFGVGFYGKEWIERRLGNSPSWKNARDAFDARAGLAVYLTRFLITALAVPTNLIAGSSGIKFRRFMLYDFLGELTWIVLYGGLGYWFGSQWEVVSDFVSNFGGLLLGLVILIAGIVLAVRWLRSR
ncbi:MAG TPA: VTT domain-containing protein [Anaerolineales bacterium]|nr:VTT domain-containing protein [Anaerolineales bacterium]